MWKKLFALFLFLLPAVAFAAPPVAGLDVTEIPPPKGMITNYQLINTNGDFSPYAENVFFDKDLGPSKRTGFAKDNTVSFGSAPVRGLWRFVSTNRIQYLVALASTTLRYSVNNSSWIVITSSVSSTENIEAVAAFGRLTLTGPTTTFYWTGSGTIATSSTSTPHGRYIEKFQNRLAIAGVDGARSILYLSALLDPDNFTLGGASADPVAFTIGANDGDVITGIYTFANSLVIFKNYSTWVLTGSSQADFGIRNVSQTIGCIQSRSIQEKQGKLDWLSKRGLEEASFNKLFADSIKEGDIALISEPVKDIVDNIKQGFDTETLYTKSDTSQSDFSMGYGTYTSVSAVPDAVVVASPTQEVSIATVNLVAVTTAPNLVSFFSLADTTMFGAEFNTAYQGFSCLGAHHLLFGVWADGPTPGTSTALGTIDLGACTASDVTPQGYLPIWKVGKFSPAVQLLKNTTYWIGAYSDTIGTRWTLRGATDYISSVISYTSTGVFAGDPYLPKFTPEDLAHRIRVSSAIFSSSVKDLGSMISRFSTFDGAYSLTGGQVLFYVRGAGTAGGVFTSPWLSVVVGGTIPLTTQEFVQWRVDFIADSSSHVFSLQDVSLNYVTSDSKQQVASWVIDDRYYLAHTTRTASNATNDAILLYDRAGNFSRFTNISALSFADAFDRHYFGASVSTGFVYYFNDSYSDDGAAIQAVLELKDFCGKDCIRESFFHDFYLRTKNPGSGAGSVTVEYQTDNSGVYASMGQVALTEATGLITARVPVPFGSAGSRGRSIRIRLKEGTLGQDFRFYGGRINFETIMTDE